MQPTQENTNVVRRMLAMAAFIVAGEAIFFLPFVVARVFRPTLLDVFGLTNLELGAAYSVYGLVAMAAYFLGGPIADRFPPRKMMSLALIATAAGGGVMVAIPSPRALMWLYGFWGVTTILLFWSPLIRATREWAGKQLPGRAFGLLDGGRGLVAAAVGSIAVAVFAWALPADPELATPIEQAIAFRRAIWVFILITIAASVFVWLAVRDDANQKPICDPGNSELRLAQVVKMPTLWLQSVIVVAAYAGYKGLDDVSLYAKDALGFDQVEAAGVSAVTLWVRPVAAIGAGVIADRVGVVRMTVLCFLALSIGATGIAAGLLQPGMTTAIFGTILTTSAALFALRGLYFAIMEEGHVPMASTGTAVGLVSVIGYTPDVFMGPLMGYLLDRSPGAVGHQHVFAVIAAFGWVGLIAALLFGRVAEQSMEQNEDEELPAVAD